MVRCWRSYDVDPFVADLLQSALVTALPRMTSSMRSVAKTQRYGCSWIWIVMHLSLNGLPVGLILTAEPLSE
jgi:hypothetical protein